MQGMVSYLEKVGFHTQKTSIKGIEEDVGEAI
jgi:hypothetical protein